jgi:hypothetical protein
MTSQMFTAMNGLKPNKGNLASQNSSHDVKSGISNISSSCHSISQKQVNIENRDDINNESVTSPTCYHVEK